MPLLTKMIARCGYMGCAAEREIEVELVPAKDPNIYGSPMRIQSVVPHLPPRWGFGPLGDIYCPLHQQLLNPAGEEQRAQAIECPLCGARAGEPCHNAGEWTPTHRLRREKAGSQ